MSNSDSRAEAIFAAAGEIADPGARRGYLDRACAGDEPLRREVESLLAADAQAGEVLEGALIEVVAAKAGFGASPGGVPPGPAQAGTTSALAERPGTRIGRYKLLEKSGEGDSATPGWPSR